MNTYICNKHDDIVKKSIDILNYIRDGLNQIRRCNMDNEADVENTLNDLNDILSNIKYSIDDIKNYADEAKEDGQNMENRLQQYYDAIIDLGFTRNNQ